jgi:hypothetical protein
MRKPGRPSKADLAVVQGNFGNRPEPPADLTERQAEIWRLIVAGEPADFFATEVVRGLLADYCRHRESCDLLSQTIGEFNPAWLKTAKGAKTYSSLLNMRDKEAAACARMATKLRLTNQSRYTPQAAATAAKHTAASAPWDFK